MDTFKANSNVETPDVDHENVIAGKKERRRSRKLSRMDTIKVNSNVETSDVDHENVIAGKKELVQTCSLDSLLQSTMWGPPNVI